MFYIIYSFLIIFISYPKIILMNSFKLIENFQMYLSLLYVPSLLVLNNDINAYTE